MITFWIVLVDDFIVIACPLEEAEAEMGRIVDQHGGRILNLVATEWGEAPAEVDQAA